MTLGYRIVDTTGEDPADWSKVIFHTYEAAAKHAKYLNEKDENGSI